MTRSDTPAYMCPVCNGIALFNVNCPHCQTLLIDQGMWQNYFDDYSPYLEIEDMKFVNGFDDARKHHCIHFATCPQCGEEVLAAVEEVDMTKNLLSE